MTFKHAAANLGNGLLNGMSAIHNASINSQVAELDEQIAELQERRLKLTRQLIK